MSFMEARPPIIIHIWLSELGICISSYPSKSKSYMTSAHLFQHKFQPEKLVSYALNKIEKKIVMIIMVT